jgi:hypothetical protein
MTHQRHYAAPRHYGKEIVYLSARADCHSRARLPALARAQFNKLQLAKWSAATYAGIFLNKFLDFADKELMH